MPPRPLLCAILAVTVLTAALPFFLAERETAYLQNADGTGLPEPTPIEPMPEGPSWDVVPGTPSGKVLYVSNSGNDQNDGSRANPLLTIGAAVTLARDGDAISILPGNYSIPAVLTIKQNALSILGDDPQNRPAVICNNQCFDVIGNNFALGHITLDGEYARAADLKAYRALVIKGDYAHLHDLEIRRFTNHMIDIRNGAEYTVIERFHFHHALNFRPDLIGVPNANGRIQDGRVDAHLIVSDASHLIIRDGSGERFSGDFLQMGSSRPGAGWTDVWVQRVAYHEQPLTEDSAGFPVGSVPAENFLDTKTNPNQLTGRSKVYLQDLSVSGLRPHVQSFIANMAQFNVKETVTVYADRITCFDSEICFRLRGADTEGFSHFIITNSLMYDSDRPIRIEDYKVQEHARASHIWNTTIGGNITTGIFQVAGEQRPEIDVRNLLILEGGPLRTGTTPGVLPWFVNTSENMIVPASAFVNAALHDYHLAPGSPAIDAGVNILGISNLDLDRTPRLQGAAYDMGAYEFRVQRAGNTAPVIQSATLSLDEDTIFRGNLSPFVRDAENDPIQYILKSRPSHGSLTVNSRTGEFTYAPTENFVGSDAFTFIANDGTANSQLGTILLDVRNTNDAPLAEPGSFTTNVDEEVLYPYSAQDPDSDPLRAIIVTPPEHGTATVNADGSRLVYIPTPGFIGNDQFTYKVEDPSGLSSPPAAVRVTVESRRDIPNAIFVSEAGNDTNAGTRQAPFRTIQHALNVAPSGSTVLVKDGAYRENVATVKPGVTVCALHKGAAILYGRVTVNHPDTGICGVTVDGEWGGNPLITLGKDANNALLEDVTARKIMGSDLVSSEVTGNVTISGGFYSHVLDPDPNTGIALRFSGGQNIRITGAECTVANVCVGLIEGKKMSFGDILIDNVNFHAAPLPWDLQGIPAGTVIGNRAIDTAYWNPNRAKIVIQRSSFSGFAEYTVRVMSSFELRLLWNRFTNNSVAFIGGGTQWRGPGTDIEAAYGNIFTGNKHAFRYDNYVKDEASCIRVYFNTFFRNTAHMRPGVSTSPTPPCFDVRNNIFADGGLPAKHLAQFAGQNLVPAKADIPLYFVNPEGGDFHLRSGAPAIDAGTPITVVQGLPDLGGRSRDERPDMGAWEYCGTSCSSSSSSSSASSVSSPAPTPAPAPSPSPAPAPDALCIQFTLKPRERMAGGSGRSADHRIDVQVKKKVSLGIAPQTTGRSDAAGKFIITDPAFLSQIQDTDALHVKVKGYLSIEIPGAADALHGACSDLTNRLLLGDLDGDGKISLGELVEFVQSFAAELSQRVQETVGGKPDLATLIDAIHAYVSQPSRD